MNPTPQKWISKTLKCHYCGFPLKMQEWGDWGNCTNEYCRMVWCMFQDKPKDTEHYQGEEAIK